MILILGAGVFGLSAAWSLRGRGHGVTVLDAGRLPREEGSSVDSSRAVRMDYADDEHHSELARRALEGWRAWNARASAPLYHQDGMLFLTREPWGSSSYEALSYALLSRRGAKVERLDEATIRARYPMFRPGAYVDGYLSHEAGWADARGTVAFLVDEVRRAGVEVREEVAVARLTDTGVELEDGSRVEADHVLVATGAWSRQLLPELESRLRAIAQPVVYVRPPGDPALWRSPNLPVWAADISTTGWYAFPADVDGLVKIGHHGPGREADPDAPRTVQPSDEERLRAWFEADVPGLAGAEIVRARTCFYADTADGDFLIGRSDNPRISVATGGSGHGFKFAPVLGELIADAVEGKPNPELQRYRLERPIERRSEPCRFDG